MTHSKSTCLKALAPQPAKAPLVCACGGLRDHCCAPAAHVRRVLQGAGGQDGGEVVNKQPRRHAYYVSHYPNGYPCRVPDCALKSRNGRCELTGHTQQDDRCLTSRPRGGAKP